MTDEELIEGILKRDRVALKYLVDHYQEKVIRTAYGFLRNMEDAEDLSQEIFVEIVRSLTGFRKSSSLSTWIYRITVNKSLNMVKKEKWRRIFSGFLSDRDILEPAYNSPDPLIHTEQEEKKERKKILDEAINRLSENQRIAFALHKIDELSYKEIAEIMNISLSSVESLIHRAKLNLQKILMRHYSEYINS
jgi:RNA polymerase sigma-70 factor, ECF subfamily